MKPSEIRWTPYLGDFQDTTEKKNDFQQASRSRIYIPDKNFPL